MDNIKIKLNPIKVTEGSDEDLLDKGWEVVSEDSFASLEPNNTEGWEEVSTGADTSLANRFKNVIAGDVGILAGITTMLNNIDPTAPIPEKVFQGFKNAFPILQALDVKEMALRGPKSLEAMQTTQEKVLSSLGGTPIATPDDFLGATSELAKQSIIDPLSYVGFPLKASSLLKGAGTAITASPGIVGGGELGETTEQVFSSGEDTGKGKLIGSLLGGGLGVGIGGSTLAGIDAVRSSGKQVLKGWANKEQLANEYSKPVVAGFLQEAAKVEGGRDINKIIDNYSKIYKGIVGVDAPLLTAMSDNPVVKSTIINLMMKDPTYVAKVNQEINRVKTAITKNLETTFGPSALDLSINDNVIDPKRLKDLSDLKDRVTTYDNKIDRFSQKFDTNFTDEQLGEAISNLITVKSKDIKDNVVSPLYNSVKEDAIKNGIKMPPVGTKMIYQFVKKNRLENLFTKGSRIERDINNYFKPTKEGFPEVSFSNVMSLKENINQLKRDFANSPAEFRKVNELSKIVDEARAFIPGDYNERLRVADATYYKELGVPFNEQGILDIDSAKYAERVAKLITRTPAALSDFLSVAGPQGQEIAKNAVISDFYKTTNGNVTPTSIQKYLFKKKDVISQIDGLENELKAAAIDSEKLLSMRKDLNDKAVAREKEIADNFLFSYGKGGPNYSSLASNMLNNRGTLDKVLKDINNLNPEVRIAVTNTLRRATIENVLTHPNGALDFVNKPDNAKTLSLVLGKEYVTAVKNFATLSDSIARLDPSRIPIRPNKQEMDAMGRMFPGLDTPYISSTLRDRISSPFQKAVRLASRMSNELMSRQSSQMLGDVLLDREALIRFNKETANLGLESPITREKVLRAYSNLVIPRAVQATKASEQSQEPSEEFTPVPIGQFQ